MFNIFKIALRNLTRYKRRTFLTASLITVGVVFVLVFIAVTGSFKHMMVGQITDSFVGHIQIHKKGYLASIDNLPLITSHLASSPISAPATNDFSPPPVNMTHKISLSFFLSYL